MQFVNNEPNQIEIRKSQNTLIVVGTGIIIFSIWTAVKMLGLLFLLRNETVETLREKMGPIEGLSDKSLFWMLVGISVIVIALLSGVRMYIGLSAIAVVVGSTVFKQPVITIYIYGAGLIYTAVLRIASAFRRTRIVYIQ